MKITIDNTLKTIEIDQDVNLSELIDTLDELGIEWEEYKIVATKIVYYTTPSIPYVSPYNPDPLSPPWTITCSL